MIKNDLDFLLEKLRSGTMSEKQVVNEICSFVAKNYPLYGLHKYDEDFRQDILLRLLERGPHLLQLFNPNFGDFFTFLYCYVSTLINTTLKKRILTSFRENLNVEECIDSLGEKEIKYHRIDYTHFEVPKAPFVQKQMSSEELRETFKQLSLKQNDKKIVVLALKSSYYLTDEQIERICKISGIKPEYFYNMIQHCKETLEKKSDKRQKALERRNYAYYHHKRYNKILQKLDNTDEVPEYKLISKQQFIRKDKKHLQNWHKLNNDFEKGYLLLRPTNKTIADIMGICERQVNYYINCARKDLRIQD